MDKKLERLSKLRDDVDIEIFEAIDELEDKIEEVKSNIPDLDKVLESVKGKDGKDGETPDIDEIVEKTLELIPTPKDGITPIKGKDYFTNTEIEQIKKEIKPIKGKDYFDGKDGCVPDVDEIVKKTLKKIELPKNGKDGKDGSPDKPEEIVKKLESLSGEKRLDASAIKNLPKILNKFDGGYPRSGGLPDLAGSNGKFLFSNGNSMSWADTGCLKLNGSNSPTSNINWGGYKITNLSTPSSDQDAATKKYVDDAVGVENLFDRVDLGSDFCLYPHTLTDNIGVDMPNSGDSPAFRIGTKPVIQFKDAGGFYTNITYTFGNIEGDDIAFHFIGWGARQRLRFEDGYTSFDTYTCQNVLNIVDWNAKNSVGINTTQPVNALDVCPNLYNTGGIFVGSTPEIVPANGAIFKGNVGVGSLSVSDIDRELVVSGVAKITRNSDSAAVILRRTGSGTKSFFFGASASGANNGIFQIADYGAAENAGPFNRLVISNVGDVSIGGTITASTLAGATLTARYTGEVGVGSTTKLSALTTTPRASFTATGTTTANASTTITGSGTLFLSEIGIGDRISLSSASSTYAYVTAIASDTSLTVSTALGNGTSQTITVLKSSFRANDSTGAQKLLVDDQGNTIISGDLYPGLGRSSFSFGNGLNGTNGLTLVTNLNAQWKSTNSNGYFGFSTKPNTRTGINDMFLDNAGNFSIGSGTSGVSSSSLFLVTQTTVGYGTVSTPGNSTTLTGVGTQFTNTFKVGDTITVNGESARTIATITSDTVLDVTVAFSATPRSGVTYTLTGGDRFAVKGNGRVMIGGVSPTNDLSFGGNSARTIWLERHTTSNTAGSTLNIQSGGATSGATDKDGGMFTLSPGVSTGTGKNSIRLQGLSRASSTGTSDNSLFDRFIIPSEFNLTNSSANSLFDISLNATEGTAGSIEFAIFASDGTNSQIYKGKVDYTAVNKAGVYTTSIVESLSTSSLSSGTLTTSWSIVSGTNKVTVKVTPTSSLTATVYKIRYTLTNLSNSTITQL